jgi:hypothetical protein
MNAVRFGCEDGAEGIHQLSTCRHLWLDLQLGSYIYWQADISAQNHICIRPVIIGVAWACLLIICAMVEYVDEALQRSLLFVGAVRVVHRTCSLPPSCDAEWSARTAIVV